MPPQVKRGVRQGDPLSCFLFDIGIEPLACLIRNTEKLKGYDIPGLKEKLIINLFADDTVLYLSAEDSYDEAIKVLDKWCEASGAKFNKEKTEIIPIGTQTHREEVSQSRKLNPEDQPISGDVRIAKDGEATQSLGAWIGNRTLETRPWEPIIDLIHQDLDCWKSVHPTLDGKRLIIQTVVGGRTQFLTKAQGMPEQIREAITKEIRRFLWENDDHVPRLGLNHLEKTKEQGGIKLLNLNLTQMCPAWAFVTDILIHETIPKNQREESGKPRGGHTTHDQSSEKTQRSLRTHQHFKDPKGKASRMATHRNREKHPTKPTIQVLSKQSQIPESQRHDENNRQTTRDVPGRQPPTSLLMPMRRLHNRQRQWMRKPTTMHNRSEETDRKDNT
jgi:hypothetical protein